MKYNFDEINKQAEKHLLELCQAYLPNGKIQFNQYVAFNPNRNDYHLGSFKINLENCLWADFATDDKGYGAIALIAYVLNISYVQAAKEILLFLKEKIR